METIPELRTAGYNGKAMQDAIKAFAMAIASQKAPAITATADALDSHGVAIGSIRSAIRRCRTAAPDELSAAIMFLFLSEILLPSASSSRFHVDGLAQLMSAKGPSYYSRGIPHALFRGFRPAIIVWFISNRKAAFLGSPEWCTIPFRETPPDPLQSLMAVGARLASALEAMDGLRTLFEPSALCDCLDSMNDIMKGLDNWKASQLDGIHSPQTCAAEERAISTDDITYHDITEANIFTHFWAFRILCAVQAQSIYQLLYGVRSLPPVLDITESTLTENATSIMRSVEYLTRPEMKLYGAISLVLPLKVSYEYLECHGGLSEKALWERAARNINVAGHGFLYQYIMSDVHILWPLRSVTRSSPALNTH